MSMMAPGLYGSDNNQACSQESSIQFFATTDDIEKDLRNKFGQDEIIGIKKTYTQMIVLFNGKQQKSFSFMYSYPSGFVYFESIANQNGLNNPKKVLSKINR